jgi:hypothetical protein
VPEITWEISRKELEKLAAGEKLDLHNSDKISLSESAEKVFEK